MRNPSTSQRRSPPSSINHTIARSRSVRSVATSRSTSSGPNTRGSRRGARTNGLPRNGARPGRADRLRGTGFRATTPRAAR